MYTTRMHKHVHMCVPREQQQQHEEEKKEKWKRRKREERACLDQDTKPTGPTQTLPPAWNINLFQTTGRSVSKDALLSLVTIMT